MKRKENPHFNTISYYPRIIWISIQSLFCQLFSVLQEIAGLNLKRSAPNRTKVTSSEKTCLCPTWVRARLLLVDLGCLKICFLLHLHFFNHHSETGSDCVEAILSVLLHPACVSGPAGDQSHGSFCFFSLLCLSFFLRYCFCSILLMFFV